MIIMDEVSKILGIYIKPETLDKEIAILDRSGRISQKKMLELMVVIIKYLYEQEKGTPIQST